MIEARNIYKSYGDLAVLKGVSLKVDAGKIVCIVGASGAGKSTLLHIMGTLDIADKGEIVINNTELTSVSQKMLAKFRNQHIGFVFQFHHLLPEFTAAENVSIPAYIGNKPKKEADAKAKDLLDYLGLTDRMDHKPGELSGGEQQRVAVARALINDPDVILADEPSGNLDSTNANELHKLFFDLRDKFKKTFIIVTHNEALADMADKKFIMKDGVVRN